MAGLLFDFRDCIRSLRRDRSYSAAVILTLAITLGATAAMFSIVDGVLLKPLAYREAHRLVALNELWHQFKARASPLAVNERHFEYWREHARSFESLAQYRPLPANLTGAGEAAQVVAVRSSGTLFDVLQVQASLGRVLSADDERLDRPEVTVITDRLWRQRLGADRGVIGRTIGIDGKPRTIVGVLPAGFRLPADSQLRDTIDAFVPLRFSAGWSGDHNHFAIARLREGVTVEHARAELDVLQGQVSEIATREVHETVTLSSLVTPLGESIVGRARQSLLVLFAAIGAVLLIACSNLANLSLTRTIGRVREAAIRSALGASRMRIVRRAALEQLVLSATGGGLGLWVAWLALIAFVRTAPVDLPRVHEVGIDARVLAFMAIAATSTGLLVALIPAWRLAGGDVQLALRAGGAAVASDRSGLRTRGTLTAIQVALSVTLLVVTGLLGVSFVRLLNVERGFSGERLVGIGLSLPTARYSTEPATLAVYERVLAGVRVVPGVESAATTSLMPLTGTSQVNFIVPAGSNMPRHEQPSANFRMVAPDFFQAMGIRLVRGRTFADGERVREVMPAVVSEPVAERFWPGQDPIGKQFSRGLTGEAGFEVVGVATDARTTSLERTPPLMVYVPYWWHSRASASLLVKTAAGDPVAVMPAIRRIVHAVDPEIALGEPRRLDDLVDASLSGRRYQTQLFVAFGVVALFIAAVGVYAVTSYSVSRRRREMNIRAALGAQRGEVIAMVVRQSGGPILAGVVAGIAGAIGAGQLVAGLLFGVGGREPLVVVGVVVLVAAVGMVTATGAARQGISTDAAAALRDE